MFITNRLLGTGYFILILAWHRPLWPHCWRQRLSLTKKAYKPLVITADLQKWKFILAHSVTFFFSHKNFKSLIFESRIYPNVWYYMWGVFLQSPLTMLEITAKRLVLHYIAIKSTKAQEKKNVSWGLKTKN